MANKPLVDPFDTGPQRPAANKAMGAKGLVDPFDGPAIPEPVRAEWQERPGMAEGVANSYFQGAGFGGSDEAAAAIKAGLKSATSDVGYGEAYDNYLGDERRNLSQFREDHPYAATTAEITGALQTSFIPGFSGPRAATTGGRFASAVGTGAAQGGVYGFNAGDGGLEDRVYNAGKTAALGGALGVASLPVGYAVGRGVDRFLKNRLAKRIGLSPTASEVLREVKQADDSLHGAGARRLRDAGDDAMLADAGPSGQAVLDTAMQRSGPAARVGREAVEGRATEASHRLNQEMDRTLGAPEGVRATARDIASGTKQARGEAYKHAYAQPIDYASPAGRAIEDVLDRVPPRVMKEAVETANERMRVAGVRNQQILIDIAEDGSVVLKEKPNVQQLDEIKKALGEMGAEAVDQYGRKTGAGNMYSNLARDIKSATDGAVPEYGAAVRLGGDKIERDRALMLGYDLLKRGTTREIVRESVQGMSDHARQEAMRGLRSTIDDTLAEVKRAVSDGNMDVREAVKLVKDMSSRANREKVSLVVGQNVDDLFREIDSAARAFELKANTAANSKTFARTAVDNAVQSKVGANVSTLLRSAEPVDAAKQMAANLMGGGPNAKKKLTDDVMLELVEVLTQRRGPDASQALQQMERMNPIIQSGSQNAKALVDALLKRNAAVSAPLTNLAGRP